MKKRMANYDLLRIISMFAVILLHINAHYLSGENKDYYEVESFINIVTRFSVPCFVMISGAFSLSNLKNQDFSYFYRKTINNIVLPFLGALSILFLLSLIKAIVTGASIIDLLVAVFIGDFSNLWFMFMICGLYFFTPIIMLVKEKISYKAFSIVSFIWLAFAVYFQSFSEYLISYSFGIVFAYMGYYLVGNVIFERIPQKKRPGLYIILSLCLFITLFLIRKKYNITRYSMGPYISFFSPLTAIASLLLFLGFSDLSLNISFGNFSRQTFYIYLFHTIIFGALFNIIKDTLLINEIATILFISIATFIISWIVALMYIYIWKLIFKKNLV